LWYHQQRLLAHRDQRKLLSWWVSPNFFWSWFHLRFRRSKLGLHADDEPLHFSRLHLDCQFYAILSWSFGASRKFIIRHKRSRVQHEVLIESGDVLCMAGNFQSQYVHW
jgi:hypothetical protein